VQLQRRIERRLAAAVGHQFDTPKQAAAADVADMRMRGEVFAQRPFKIIPPCAHLRQQPAFAHRPLHRQRTGAGGGVADVGVGMGEGAAAGADRIDDPV
jgi:hypothetical protein